MFGIYDRFDLYWGDSHLNIHGDDVQGAGLTGQRLRNIMKTAAEHLDFLPIAYYPFESYYKNGLRMHSVGPRERFFKEWELVRQAVAEANNPGEFVTFLGYEWHGDRTRYGDHNVFFLNDNGRLDHSETIPELYDNLKGTDAIVVPHHTAYQVGQRGKDWDFFDEELSYLVEIYSSHGSSEGVDTPYPIERIRQMGPGVSGGTVQDGLRRGYRFGIIASGDNHRDYAGEWGNGLMAVFAEEKTRTSVWDAFKKRRVYGVTGDRMQLFFSVNGCIMGEKITSDEPAQIGVKVIGCHSIDRIEIIRNGRVLQTYCHPENWNIPRVANGIRAKLRIQCGWGPERYTGFSEIEGKVWKGRLQLSEGRIIGVEPCFTDFGQKIEQVSSHACEFEFTSHPSMPSNKLLARHHRTNLQGAIIEFEASIASQISLDGDPVNLSFSVADSLNNERLVALTDETEAMIGSQFGVHSEDVENVDVYWNNAWKMKLGRAIPYEQYCAEFSYTDNNPNEGENYYYVRVTQLNGQMAWSSPIWMNYEGNT